MRNCWIPILVLLVLVAGAASAADKAKRVIVLGVDGLDPKLLQKFVDEGALPNLERLLAAGDFKPLETSMPPLSPIAWSNFITGMDPGGHGIYDFIHRDPATYMPYFSMSEAKTPPDSFKVTVGSRCVPVRDMLPGWFREDSVKNLREGRAFWQILEEKGVPATVFRMPVNFPPAEMKGQSFSGMGTPDIKGSPGTFSYFSDRPVPNASSFSGGKFYPVRVTDNRVEAQLCGPADPYRCEGDSSSKPICDSDELASDFTVYLDPENPVARFVVGDEEFILREGEWSEWVTVEFDVLPVMGSVTAIGRFYLKQMRPDFKLYVSPLQIDPSSPVMPVSTPSSWSKQLFEDLGPFYTQQLPEDTKAFSNGVFTGREFWDQGQIVFRERSRALDYFLERFEEGLLFFYFSSVDQNAHMLWQYMDPAHPAYTEDEFLMDGIKKVYVELDGAVGRTMKVVDDDTTLIVMSDHGFSPFYWGVNLNTWLMEKGYVTLKDPAKQGRYPLFANVDWSKTTAYAAGLNGLYVNLFGREKRGIVAEGEYDALLDKLEADLLELKDPRNGQQAVTLVTRTHRDFHGPHLDRGPDIVVGYNYGYRSSWKNPLGEFPKDVFVDNKDAWSGDHSIDYRLVPGVLLSNRKITIDSPALYDLTVGILDEYGVEKPSDMIGQDCLGEPTAGARGLNAGTKAEAASAAAK